MYPEDLKYTAEHEWVRDGGGDDLVRVGITDFAQESLGDIVFVTLPSVGSEVHAGEPCGEVESTKSVSDIFAPLSGVVVAVNEALDTAPDLLNTDPYGEGWICEIRPADASDVDGLLDADTYTAGLDKG